MGHIEQQVGLRSHRIVKPVNGRVTRSRNVDVDGIAGERDLVEPGRGFLIRARRSGISLRKDACGGLHQDIAVLGAAARATHMRLRKAANIVVRIPSGVGIVTRARGHVRAGLDHAERHHGTGKDIAAAGHTEQRVDIGGMIGSMLAPHYRRKQENRQQDKHQSNGNFHGLLHYQ